MTGPLTEALAGFAPAGPAEPRVAAFLAENRAPLATLSLVEIAAAVAVGQASSASR